MNSVYITRAELNQLLEKIANHDISPVVMRGKTAGNGQTVYLSERNIRTLLSKLDRAAAGESTYCTIIKQDTSNKRFPCSMEASITASEVRTLDAAFATEVFAVNDLDYYTGREPGPMHPADEIKL